MDLSEISDELVQDEDGLWTSKSTEAVSYPEGDSETFARIEDHSFWFQHRNACLRIIAEKFPPLKGGAFFDVGGGNGVVSAALMEAGVHVVLVEPGKNACQIARKRGVETVVCASTLTANFKPEVMAGVGLFDVVEHIEDDVGFLRSLWESMEPGAPVYITVPAYRALWSDEDEYAGHFRRYTQRQLQAVARAAGFEPVFSTTLFRFLPLPVLLARVIPYRLGFKKKEAVGTEEKIASDHVMKQGLLSRIMGRLFETELTRLRAKKSNRLGGSCLLVARKPAL